MYCTVLYANVADADDGGWPARAPPGPDQRVLAPAQCGHTQHQIQGALPHPGQNITILAISTIGFFYSLVTVLHSFI